MITDRLSNIGAYRGISEALDTAIDYISAGLEDVMEIGTHEIRGRDIYAVSMEYDTKPYSEGKNEAHRRYIDIQIVLKGTEMIYASCVDDLMVIQQYDGDKDVLFLEKSDENAILMNEGKFCIFFPWDAHMPGMACDDGVSRVKKVVFKVHV